MQIGAFILPIGMKVENKGGTDNEDESMLSVSSDSSEEYGEEAEAEGDFEEKYVRQLSSGYDLQAKAQEKIVDMVWFGGIEDDYSNKVFHTRLSLRFEDDNCLGGLLEIKRLRTRSGNFANLKKSDRFFYN